MMINFKKVITYVGVFGFKDSLTGRLSLTDDLKGSKVCSN